MSIGAISAGASALSDIWNLFYGTFANERNFQFQKDVFRENMDWQKYMASNQYQMKVADMKAAGLSPVLAAGGGGISSPPISSNNAGTDVPEANLGNIARNAMIGLEFMQRKQEINQSKSQEQANIALADKYKAETTSTNARTEIARSQEQRDQAEESREQQRFPLNLNALRIGQELSEADLELKGWEVVQRFYHILKTQSDISFQEAEKLRVEADELRIKTQSALNEALKLESEAREALTRANISKEKMNNIILARDLEIILDENNAGFLRSDLEGGLSVTASQYRDVDYFLKVIGVDKFPKPVYSAIRTVMVTANRVFDQIFGKKRR